jgi:hypothetical protein
LVQRFAAENYAQIGPRTAVLSPERSRSMFATQRMAHSSDPTAANPPRNKE